MPAIKEDNCQAIYYNLFTLLTYKETIPQAYFHEWAQTFRCDRFTEFKHVRDATEKYVGIETMKNIYGVHVLSEEEESKAQFALTHYRQWHKGELWRVSGWNGIISQTQGSKKYDQKGD